MIFKIRPDLENFKYYLIQNPNDNFMKFSEFGRGSFPEDLSLYLYQGRNKKEKSLRDDFNISSFSILGIFVSKELYIALNELECLEFFKVKTDNKKCFFYLNTTQTFNFLNLENNSLNDIIMNEKYNFNNKDYLNEKLIFRDENIPYEIFVTEKFLNKYQHILKGVIFEKV